MDTGTIRILDVITSSLGEPMSINQLTQKIKEKYGTAYYANTYKKIKDLQEEKILCLENYGNTSIITPNFDNFLIIDYLSEMELEKKIDFFKPRNNLLVIFEDLKTIMSEKCFLKSICSINPTRNISLNRFEFLFLILPTNSEKEIIQLYKDTKNIQNKYNLRIDSLILTGKDFATFLKSNEINPLKEAISKEITIFCPEAFWSNIRDISLESKIKLIETETKPSKITDQDLIDNLYRFGFKEFGSTITEANKYCIEYVITALLFTDDVRRLNSIPVILMKNDFNENMLVYLSQKYKTTGKLLGLLATLQKLYPNDKIKRTISILQTFGEKEMPSDESSINRNLELYDAIR
jgi:hypothetical protein